MLHGKFLNLGNAHQPTFTRRYFFKISLTALGFERATSRLGSRHTNHYPTVPKPLEQATIATYLDRDASNQRYLDKRHTF